MTNNMSNSKMLSNGTLPWKQQTNKNQICRYHQRIEHTHNYIQQFETFSKHETKTCETVHPLGKSIQNFQNSNRPKSHETWRAKIAMIQSTWWTKRYQTPLDVMNKTKIAKSQSLRWTQNCQIPIDVMNTKLPKSNRCVEQQFNQHILSIVKKGQIAKFQSRTKLCQTPIGVKFWTNAICRPFCKISKSTVPNISSIAIVFFVLLFHRLGNIDFVA